jgi:hypothetical protein
MKQLLVAFLAERQSMMEGELLEYQTNTMKITYNIGFGVKHQLFQ